ncbi:hypothetical protein Tco_0469342 [Tanacetum coccineum]
MAGSDDEIPPPPPPPPQTPTQQAPHTVSTIKLPILKKGEYDIWVMKMEHYLSHTDYPIWEVIQKGNGPVSVLTDTNGVIKVLPPKTAEEILARERERKARTTFLMALPEDHLVKFHKMTDAKDMWDAIKSRFGGNDESKKMQKYILKQQFEGFSVSNSEGLHKGYDRSLPSSWSQVSLVMRTKPGVDSLSIDDLYNNLRVFESDIKGVQVALDHYRDAFSVIYLIYAHSSNFEILTVLDIAYHAILTVLDIVYHAILTDLDIVYHAILTVLDIEINEIMPPRKAPRTRTTPATTTNTTSVTNAQLQAMIDQGVDAALATRDANRGTNGEDSHNSGTGVRTTERVARETVSHDVAYAMTCTDLKKKMTDKYCPRSEIKKLEVDLWNLKVNGTNVLGYNKRFPELALLCVRMLSKESDKIEKYVGVSKIVGCYSTYPIKKSRPELNQC